MSAAFNAAEKKAHKVTSRRKMKFDYPSTAKKCKQERHIRAAKSRAELNNAVTVITAHLTLLSID